MPRKFRRYVPKGYSRKGYKSKKSNSVEHVVNSAELQADNLQGTSTKVDFGTQTDEILNDVVPVIENEEVEVVDMVDAEIQVGEQQSQRVCVGNDDEKFKPLISKHKGVFKDSTGM